MAQFSWSMQIIQRSKGRSAVAAAAYRAGERLHDERQGRTHDYSRRSGVEHTELLMPEDTPAAWLGVDRETLWNRVEQAERRKDAQTARELRIMIPRELSPDDRIAVVRDYIRQSFVAKGMVADVAYHNKTASDGKEQPHAHVMLTMRPLTETGFGKKSRHDRVPDPTGRTNADGRPVMVESNADSWNSQAYFERCREDWETIANAALERIGSAERIDRRSLLARGLSRLPEPALRIAWYMKDLYGCMRERFGQFQFAKHYQSVERAAKAALLNPETPARDPAQLAARFYGWFDRQLDRLAPEQPERVTKRPTTPTPDMER
ncbi:MobQ family relaxase [Sphingomonas naphthae]|uniref:MobQ family relaxase n=1 Tax=Sphingomonas naphthae TaxID=1813468 RepID=A0ABY7TM22_9SPHN|nr:MobQ family relaxase [Sphingomonas naphthae]WCT74282.1 MobQ family relaxase [Sphingomonas naphthae]